MQQEANRKCGFTARRTMDVAQSLYENGHITYMRTDSTNLASVAIDMARQIIAGQYGKEYLPNAPRTYQTKVKNAQEAHEAIRPAGNHFALPEDLRNRLSPDEFRLYDLIWKRTVASQMTDARARRITIRVDLDEASFEASGKIIDFPGYLRAYVEGSDDPDSELADEEVVLPQVAVGETLECRELASKSHTTQPPNRSARPRSLASWKKWASAGRAPMPRSSTRFSPAIMSSRAATCSCQRGPRLPFRNCWKYIARPGRLPVHRQNGRRAGRHQPRQLDYVEYFKQFYFGKAKWA